MGDSSETKHQLQLIHRRQSKMSDVQASSMGYENQALLTGLGRLYMNATTSDVNFIFKLVDDQEESVPAHKNLLAVRSDVFHLMFYGEVRKNADVKIVDTSSAAFKEFLKFFYLDKVHVTMENVASVMDLGEKYNVAACLDACVELLTKNLTVENACYIYGLAILYKKRELKQLCEEKITENTEAVFASKSFLDSPKSVLRQILDLNNLSCSEADVFKACMAWVKSASGEKTITKEDVQQHLGDLFYEIRFRSMTFQEFSDLIPTYGHVFSVNETEMFTTRTRQKYVNRDMTIECNRVLEYTTKPYFFRRVETTTFSTNEAVIITELVITRLCIFRDGQWKDDQINHLPAEITVLQISVNKGATTSLSKQTAQLRCEDGTHGTIVTLSKPIFTQPGNDYKIQLKIATTEHFYKAPVLKTEVQLEPNIVFQFRTNAKMSNTKLPLSPIIALRFAPMNDALK